MFSLLLFAVLCAGCLAAPGLERYSYSAAVGSGGGTAFSTQGEGRITAIRLWETSGSYIRGIQLRYNYIWSPRIGRNLGKTHELELFDDEVIVQISGKYHTNYIYQLIFVTSSGRSLIVGQPFQSSFNFYPKYKGAELKLLSGRFNGNGIVSLAAHWGTVFMDGGNDTGTSA